MWTSEKIKNFLVFSVFAAAAFIVYRNCFDVFIPADNYSLLYYFEQGFVTGFNENAKVAAPYFVAFPLLYFLYQLFDIFPAGWMITSIMIHTINAMLVFLIAKRWVHTFSSMPAATIAFFSGLIFLISPYQTEDVLWVTINIRWLFHALVTLAGFYFFLLHLSKPSLKTIIAVQILFLLGLFSHELTLICPLLFMVLYFLFWRTRKTSVMLKNFSLQIILPQLFFIGLYFLSCKIFSGHWLWHGGTVAEVSQHSDFALTLLKYFAKFFLFYRYISMEDTDSFLRSNISSFITIGMFVLACIVLAFLFRKAIKVNKETGYLLAVLFACFLISLLPVLSLDSSFLKYIYPDRYGYLPSVFFYVFLSCSVFFILRKAAVPFMAGYSILCWLLLIKTISAWTSTNEYCSKLIENFKSFSNYDRVYVLDVPAYYNGIAAFRSAFRPTMFFRCNIPLEKIRLLSGSYHDSAADSLQAINFSVDTIEVKGANRKTPYFSTNGGNATSYETAEYCITFDSTGWAYTLFFKEEIPANSVFIYACGNTWKKAE